MKITIEELQAAVQKNGFELSAGVFGVANAEGKLDCGCALTHLYCAENPQPVEINEASKQFFVNSSNIYDWAVKKYGYIFTSSFTAGFDNRIKGFGYDEEGYANGQLLATLL